MCSLPRNRKGFPESFVDSLQEIECRSVASHLVGRVLRRCVVGIADRAALQHTLRHRIGVPFWEVLENARESMELEGYSVP